MTTKDNGLMAITKEEGVNDLQPMTVRAEFARALQSERAGDHEEAEIHLDLAIAAEIKASE